MTDDLRQAVLKKLLVAVEARAAHILAGLDSIDTTEVYTKEEFDREVLLASWGRDDYYTNTLREHVSMKKELSHYMPRERPAMVARWMWGWAKAQVGRGFDAFAETLRGTDLGGDPEGRLTLSLGGIALTLSRREWLELRGIDANKL